MCPLVVTGAECICGKRISGPETGQAFQAFETGICGARDPRLTSVRPSACNHGWIQGTTENVSFARLGGGGGSHLRTGLGLKFPGNREKTGNFAIFRRIELAGGPKREEATATYRQIPYSTEQGIIARRSGNSIAGTGTRVHQFRRTRSSAWITAVSLSNSPLSIMSTG